MQNGSSAQTMNEKKSVLHFSKRIVLLWKQGYIYRADYRSFGTIAITARANIGWQSFSKNRIRENIHLPEQERC
jgi:hypothetical protein